MLDGGIAADRGKGGVADVIAAHDHVGGAKDVDRVAVLAGAAGARAVSSMRLSAIRLPSWRLSLCQTRMPPLPDLAMMLAAISRPRLSLQNSALSAAPVIVSMRHFAVAALERDAVAAGAGDLAIGDADGFHVVEVHQARGRRAASGRRRRA